MGLARSSQLVEREPANATEKTTSFARRIIRQHPNVQRVTYVNSLVLDAHTNRGTIRVAFDDSYDLCGDSVRTAWDELRPFNVLFKNNPNGGITSDANDVAKGFNVVIADAKSIFKILWGG